MAMFPLLILQKFACTFRADKQFGDVSSALDCLEGFVVGLYAEVFNAVVCLVNRCDSNRNVSQNFYYFPLICSRCMTSNVRSSCSILLADVPGFQNLAQTTQSSNAGFEDLCHNYLNERLHVLLHETTFTSTLDLYAQVGSHVIHCAYFIIFILKYLCFNLRKTFRVILMWRR